MKLEVSNKAGSLCTAELVSGFQERLCSTELVPCKFVYRTGFDARLSQGHIYFCEAHKAADTDGKCFLFYFRIRLPIDNHLKYTLQILISKTHFTSRTYLLYYELFLRNLLIIFDNSIRKPVVTLREGSHLQKS
jgi:hypothetical protein